MVENKSSIMYSVDDLCNDLYHELTEDILPFWTGRMSDSDGGFYGRMDGYGVLHKDAPRGAVLNARIIWTLARAANVLQTPDLCAAAERAASYFRQHFIDQEYGGIFWSVDANGTALETKKQYYALAFGIYAFAELYRINGKRADLELAISLFHCIEEHSKDSSAGGYIEAGKRDWGPVEDMRLSGKDLNCAKTMNTHLHILEGYTGLYRVWKDPLLALAIKELIHTFAEHIIMPDGHMGMFFDRQWKPCSSEVSFGHDIEASWLLEEAAKVLGDQDLYTSTKDICKRLATAAMAGWKAGAGMAYCHDNTSGTKDEERHWWVQAETIVGCFVMYRTALKEQRNEDAMYWLQCSNDTWHFIREHLICPDGEWYWSVNTHNGQTLPNLKEDRAGLWKCPYHNGRMCLEIIEKTKIYND